MEEVFQVQTFDYLLKPPTEDQFAPSFGKTETTARKRITIF